MSWIINKIVHSMFGNVRFVFKRIVQIFVFSLLGLILLQLTFSGGHLSHLKKNISLNKVTSLYPTTDGIETKKIVAAEVTKIDDGNKDINRTDLTWQFKANPKEKFKVKILSKSFKVIDNHTFRASPNPTNHSPLAFTRFLIANADFCNKSNIDLLIYSHSSADNLELRLAIRKTWGSRNILRSENAALVFVVGRSLNDSVQEKIVEESKEYGDIVQADFIENYNNLTYKAFMSIQWLSIYCKNVPLFVKTDDDIFWDITTVLSKIRARMKPRCVICRIYYNNPILRNPQVCGKWCVDDDEFVGQTSYPRYCEGLIYAFDRNILEDLSIIMRYTSFYKIEDVWVGVNLNKLINLSRRSIRHWIADSWKTVWSNYVDNSDIKTKIITHMKGEKKPDTLTKLWSMLGRLKQES